MIHRCPKWLAAIGFMLVAAQATAQSNVPVKIVGIGAATCARFVAETASDSDAEKAYLAWMQGYMSGIMVGRPAGVDEGIDLAPAKFPLAAQAQFIRAFCSRQPQNDFADGVQELYVRLKRLNGT